MDVHAYNLWQRQDKTSVEVRQIKNALLKLENANPTFKYELGQIEAKVRDDSTTLSEKRRAELTELLVSYLEPLMDRHQHDTHLQSHRKYLERLAKYKRQDAIIRGQSPKGITAEEMANYSFAHSAAKGVNYGGTGGLAPNKGMDPETGDYTIILKYEGSLEISLFKKYIRKYPSSGKINLYGTLKSFFTAGHELGLTKAQLGELLINLLDTREVKESPDKMTGDIYKEEMTINPHRTILKIIKMVSRNTGQAFAIREKLSQFKRPEGLPVDTVIGTLETICEEYYRNFYPGASEEKRRRKVEEKVVAMLPDIVDKDVKKSLRIHMKENDNNGIDNELDLLRKFLSRIEGDRRHVGGQHLSSQALAYMSYYNKDAKEDRRSGSSRQPRKGRTGRGDNRRRRSFRSSSTESRTGSRSSAQTSAATSAASSRETSRGSPRRRALSSDTSRESSRASSAHSNVSVPRNQRRGSTDRRSRERKEEKKSEGKKKKDSNYNDKKKDRRQRDKSSDNPRCPLCFEEECTNRGKDKCQLRPELEYSEERLGACGVCHRGYHITTRDCLDWPLKRARMKKRRTRDGASAQSKN